MKVTSTLLSNRTTEKSTATKKKYIKWASRSPALESICSDWHVSVQSKQAKKERLTQTRVSERDGMATRRGGSIIQVLQRRSPTKREFDSMY